MSRSEVIEVRRYGSSQFETTSKEETSIHDTVCRMLDEIPIHQHRSVRISVEIVDDKKEEERVGSKAVIGRHPSNAVGGMTVDGGWPSFLWEIVKGWQPGESRKVKSINFATPSGVPEVEFVETPRERLARAIDESFLCSPDIAVADLRFAAKAVLAEGEGK